MGSSFADAIAQLTNGKATKRPSWAGYVKRTDGTDGAYSIVYVKRDGTQNTYTISSTGGITTSGAITQDVELFAGMISNDWIIGDVDQFETARTGSGTW